MININTVQFLKLHGSVVLFFDVTELSIQAQGRFLYHLGAEQRRFISYNSSTHFTATTNNPLARSIMQTLEREKYARTNPEHKKGKSSLNNSLKD